MNVIGIVVWVFTLALHAAAERPLPLEKLVFQDLYAQNVTLSPSETAPASVLFFFSNTCPVARRYTPRMIQLAEEYRARGVQFVAVNVSPADTLDDVARFAMDYEFTFPVVKDPSFDAVKALGISRTPEVTVLDRNFATVYQGRIDDQYRLGGVRPEATRHDLVDALNALLGGKEVPASHVPAEGCVVTISEDTGSELDSVPEPDPERYTVEWVGRDNEGEDGSPAKRTWFLDPAVTTTAWVSALRVEGPFQTASLYYIDKGKEARHYLAGGLLPDHPLRWDDGEAVRLPAGADLRLDTTGEMLRPPKVRMNITDTTPDWAITCVMSSSERAEGDHTSPLRILQPRPSQGKPRYVALGISNRGAALSMEFIPEVGKPIPLLSLALLTPRAPGPHALAEWSTGLEEPGSLCATLHRPGYLTWPTAVPSESDSEMPVTLFTYWAARP